MNISEWNMMTNREKTEWLEINKKIMGGRTGRPRRVAKLQGVNDAGYFTAPRVDGVTLRCPAYRSWTGMLMRAHYQEYHSDHPTYSDVSVTQEWHLFSTFRNWWIENQVDGWDLDKDLLHAGNRIYSPSGCIFVPPWLNYLISDCKSARGGLPLGVSIANGGSGSRPYSARVRMGGKKVNVGNFPSAKEAHIAYQRAKISYIDSLRSKIDDIDIRLYPSIRAQVLAKSEVSIEELGL